MVSPASRQLGGLVVEGIEVGRVGRHRRWDTDPSFRLGMDLYPPESCPDRVDRGPKPTREGHRDFANDQQWSLREERVCDTRQKIKTTVFGRVRP